MPRKAAPVPTRDNDPAAASSTKSSATTSVARAKINLCLHVTGRRDDGYHLLDGITAFAEIGDIVQLERLNTPAEAGDELAVSCVKLPKNAEVIPADRANLAWRALAAFRAALPPDAVEAITHAYRISVDKVIPSGAGLGGGSADAAAVLRLLDADLGAPIDRERLLQLGLGLGADVPVCLLQKTLRVSGIGEVLQPVTLAQSIPAVLIWPGVAMPTPAVFQRRTGDFDRPLTDADIERISTDPLGALAALDNGLADAAQAIQPVIGKALDRLGAARGCRLARMSGSGSAIFGLFDATTDADAAAAALSEAHPDWWVRSTEIGATPP
jgi:4-diphosphocytidyl-2-C-methyl-D-erythritol kinase